MLRVLTVVSAALASGAVAVGHFASGIVAGHPAHTVVLMGNPRVATGHDSETGGRSEAFPFRALRSGHAGALHVYIGRSTRARAITVGIYTSAAGRPGRLLRAGSLKHPRAARWAVLRIRAVRLAQGRSYWIALLGVGGTIAYRDRTSGSCRSAETATAHLRRLPAHWRTGRTWATCSVSAFVSGTAIRTVKAPAPAPPPGGVTAPAPPTPPPSGCFAAPHACGYPDPAGGNVGSSSPCSALPQMTGDLSSSYNGQTIANESITGTLTIKNANVIVNNVCVSADGGGQLGSSAINVADGAANTLIENTTAGGANVSNQSVEIAVKNWSSQPATLSHDYLYNCGECVHDGPWAVNDSYVISNGMQGTGDHHEAVYYDDGLNMSFNHDTLLNPENESAVIFGDNVNGGPCTSDLTVANSLLAGGGMTIVACGGDKSSSVGSSVTDISGNRFARCTTPPIRQTSDGGYTCQGATSTDIGSGADSHGYWPKGGHYSPSDVPFCPPTKGQTWTGNVWDDNGAQLSC
jgi:hypothetical protein